VIGSFEIHLFAFLSSSIICTGIVAWSWRNKNRQAISAFIAFTGIVGLWSASTVIQILSSSHELLTALFYVNRFCIIAMSLLWFYFGLAYAGYGHILKTQALRVIIGLFGGSMILFGSIPPLTNLIYEGLELSEGVFSIVYHPYTTTGTEIIRIFGLLFVLTASFTIVYRLIDAGYAQTWQVISVLLATSGAIIFEYVQPQLLTPVDAIDYSPLIVTLTILVYVLTLYRYDLFGHRPVAKDDIIESVADPVLAINPDDAIVNYNTTSQEFFGDKIKYGIDASEALPDGVVETYDIDNPVEGYEQISLTNGDDIKYYNVHVSPLEDMSGEKGIALSIRDITELHQRSQDLEQQTEQLENFASIVSHDLRNPLHVAEVYAEKIGTETGSEDAEKISAALERMGDIIDDALVLAREGQAIENTENAQLNPVVASAWEMSRTDEATLSNQIGDEFTFHMDQDRVQTLLENLFRNSVDHGGDDVNIQLGELEERHGFYIEDDGTGISDGDKERVFHQGFTTNNKGTGFGLSIVKSIADSHGWHTTVTDSSDGGARFEFACGNDNHVVKNDGD